MGGGRQAWCPRCDEVRSARPGGACPACGRPLLTVPPARPGQPRPKRADRVAARLRALLPAATAVGVALLVLAVVASAFAAGRLTRTTPSAPAAAPATTGPGFLDEGPETGRREFGWRASAGGLTVELRTVTSGVGFSRMELHVDGVPVGREVDALKQLRIRDADGKDLLERGAVASLATATSRPAGPSIHTEVVLDQELDLQEVASVELGGLTVASDITEVVNGALVDPELQRKLAANFDDRAWLANRRGCPDCRLRLACEDCRTIRVTGSTYRRGRVAIAVEAVGPLERTALNPSRRRVLITDEDGIAEAPAWVDGNGASGVITVGADELATVRPGAPEVDQPMIFRVVLESQSEQVVRGPWTIRQAGG